MRTQTSDTILNADGTWTLKQYGTPINFKDAKGAWQPIDPTLVSDTSNAGYAFESRANSWHVHFASAAGGPHLVHAQFPGANVGETLSGTAQVPASPTGSTVVYAGILPGVNLRLLHPIFGFQKGLGQVQGICWVRKFLYNSITTGIKYKGAPGTGA